MENLVVILVILLVIAAAGLYVYKAKKAGQKCIGCPHCDSCQKHKNA